MKHNSGDTLRKTRFLGGFGLQKSWQLTAGFYSLMVLPGAIGAVLWLMPIGESKLIFPESVS